MKNFQLAFRTWCVITYEYLIVSQYRLPKKMRVINILSTFVLFSCAVMQDIVRADGIPSEAKRGRNQFELTDTIQTVLNATLIQQKNVTRKLSAQGDGSIFGCLQAEKSKKYVILRQSVNWFDALTLCKVKKMDLATIRSQKENDLFEETVRKSIVPLALTKETPYLGVWIGGTNLHSRDLHYWMTDGQLFVMTYSNWYKPTKEPSHPDLEHCVAVDFRDGVWGGADYRPGQLAWNDWQCSQMLPFFACEYFV